VKRLVLTLSLVLAAGPALTAAHAAAPAAYIEKAVADPSRPADDRKTDAVRKPDLVLAFAGVKPGQTVGEYLPGGGYYTRMLSDVVGPKGKVYALETTTWGQQNIDATKAVLSEPGRSNVSLDLAPLGMFSLPEKVDLFWTTLNYHDLHIAKYAVVDMATFNKHVYDSLKPGGIYFIEDHAAAPGSGLNDTAKLHRIDRASVVSEVEAAGFKLVGESDVLKDPGDDHSKPVFDLHLKTDQFLLKFRKPG
jgi:predicted methyltransferase